MKLTLLLVLLCLCAGLFAVKTIPNFTLSDINGKDVQLSKVLEKGPVLIDFWATWCTPCTKELPRLDELQKKYPGVTFLAITVDAPKTAPRAKALVKEKKFSFTTLFDSNELVMHKLNVPSLPQTFIVNQNSEIVYEHNGYNVGDENKLDEELQKLFPPAQPDSLR
jgi:peroxiredoxin